jgi:probable F420-dependent oxidoreductase
MKIGVATAFNKHTTPETIVETAKIVEHTGLHSLWVPEHVVFFEHHESRYPYSDDGRIPGNPDGLVDPFSALAYIAGHTSRIRLGTGICLVPQRNPIYTARQVADVDFLSGGRFDFGVGVGWLKEEFRSLGVPWERRGARTADYIEAMKALWTQGEASHDGEFVQFERCLQHPKPVQKPHPPIFFGGESEAALARVAVLGQGWYGYNLGPEDARPLLDKLDVKLSEVGRTREDISVFLGIPRRAANPDALAELGAMGVEQVIVPLGGRTLDDVRRRAEAFAALAARSEELADR